jgi:steroid delta-isomerase-like uncharacterized protein
MADNRELARQFYEVVFNAGELDRVEEFCTPDLVDHEETPEGLPDGIEGVKAFVRMFRDGFPDLHASVEDVLADGDRVATRVRLTGTHEGEFMGIPPSGNKIEIETMDIVRVENGKAAEHWGLTDGMALMTQIGALSPDAAAQS